MLAQHPGRGIPGDATRCCRTGAATTQRRGAPLPRCAARAADAAVGSLSEANRYKRGCQPSPGGGCAAAAMRRSGFGIRIRGSGVGRGAGHRMATGWLGLWMVSGWPLNRMASGWRLNRHPMDTPGRWVCRDRRRRPSWSWWQPARVRGFSTRPGDLSTASMLALAPAAATGQAAQKFAFATRGAAPAAPLSRACRLAFHRGRFAEGDHEWPPPTPGSG